MGDSKLEIERHIKHWQRCLRTLLPTAYTSNDSSRMALGFFILSALDLLGAGEETISDKDRANIRDGILRCQHPYGGFCGSPNHRFPDEYYLDIGQGKQLMDPANLPATYFAILSLTFVGALDNIKRRECLGWLRTLQREDGSFGELVADDGKIQGGRDMRYCYVATAIRWILRGYAPLGYEEDEEDINVENLVNHLRSGQTYDGGISESTTHEAHAGYTYCAIASLSFLNCLPHSSNSSASSSQDVKVPEGKLAGLTNLPGTIRWLVSRQVGYNNEEDDEDDDDPSLSMQEQRHTLAGIYKESAPTAGEPPSIAGLSLQGDQFVGFNGRCNKRVDTCYTFWVTASLAMLGQDKAQLISAEATRRFLFEQTQHRIGGFGKTPGDPPDIYHSYLGLAALATMKEPGIKPLDPALCVSTQQREKIDSLRKTALVPTRQYWKHGYAFSVRQDHPEFETKIASGEEPPKSTTDALERPRTLAEIEP